MTAIKLFSIVATSATLAFSLLLPVSAQVIPDGTTSTTVDIDGTINNGDRAGSNLFHSFSEFSVPTGGQAFFNNSVDIVNIFSRVTGGNISNIDGILGANGTANLFLINPAGIIFGENASLDIGGSFFGSTADSIIFPDGEFSATDLNNPPLITINAPIGLGIRDNPADIVTTLDPTGQSFANLTVNQGQSINLIGGNLNLDRSFINAPGGTIELGGLAVSGEVLINNDGSLSFPEELTRSDVSLNNGTLVNVAADNGGAITVNANNLEILGGSNILAGIVPGSQIAEAQAGDITINVTEKISLTSEDPNTASIIGNNVGGLGDLFTAGSSGNVIINTKILEGNGNFRIGSATNGEGNAGNVTITATEEVSLLGIEGAGSGILSVVAPSATGNGADITITTPSLILSNSSLTTSTIGQGSAGNIFINATDSIAISNISQLQAASFGNGDAGNIVIEAATAGISLEGENVRVATLIASSELFANTNLQPVLASLGIPPVSTGQGGDIIIRGRNLSVTDGASLLTTTAGQVTSERLANAGNIQIDVSENVTFTGGSLILSQTAGQGNAGNVTITAGNLISFDGENIATGISTTVEILPEFLGTNFNQQRQGGTINITASSFSLSNGAAISSSINGEGDGGTISVTTSENILIDGTVASGIFNTVNQGAIGDGGRIEITTNNLAISNGGVINASTSGQGNGGTISVTANESISLDGTTPSGLFASGIFNTVAQGAIGNGSSIEVTTNNLAITNGATINASTSGQGNGGTISVTANESISLDGTAPNDLFASGIGNLVNQGAIGNGGSIEVTTNNLAIANGAGINASTSGQGNGGTISVTANESISLDGTTPNDAPSGISSEVAIIDARGNGGSIEIATNNLAIANGAVISASTRGEGDGGNILVTANDRISLDGTIPDGTASSGIFNLVNQGAIGDGGGIVVTTNNLEITNGAVINAGTFGEGNGGNILVTANDRILLDGIAPNGSSGGIGSEVAVIDVIGNGGSVEVITNNLEITNGAIISTSTVGAGNGGDIQLRVEDTLILRENGAIFAVASNNANSGNININAEFIIGFPSSGFGSDIRTNAGEGQGGNINIIAQGILGFRESRLTAGQQNNINDIDASSQTTGLDGIVRINNPDVNPLQGVNRLPTNPVSAETIATDACSATGGETNLIIQGKGGIPPEPNEPLPAESLIPDGQPITLEKDTNLNSLLGEKIEQEPENPYHIPAHIKPVKTDHGDIYPARGVIVREDGNVILTAYPNDDKSNRIPQAAVNCNS